MNVYELIYWFNNIFITDYDKGKIKKINVVYIRNAYNRIMRILLKQFTDNEKITVNKLKQINITQNMKNKLIDIIQNKKNEFISIKEKNKKNEFILYNKLNNIDGIGSKKAKDLIRLGIKNKNDLKKKKWQGLLNEQTRILINYDISKNISNNFINEIKPKLIYKNKVYLVGGFLRNKPFSKDIDIIFVKKKINDLEHYINYLKSNFNIIIYLNGCAKMSILIKPKLNTTDVSYSTNTYVKMDIFITNSEEKYFMILYGTGSKEFNIKMRSIAKRKGYILNQKGLLNIKTNKYTEVSSENDIFNFLNIKYVKPENR